MEAQFTAPELQDYKVITWNWNVTESSLGECDTILGRDALEFLGIDIKFSDQTVQWDHASMPFKDAGASMESYHVDDPEIIHQASDHLKKILDAKYEAADLREVCAEQHDLSKEGRKGQTT